MTTFVAPGEAFSRLASVRAIRSMKQNGTIVPASRGVNRTYTEEVIAYRDTIVHRVGLNGTPAALVSNLTDQNTSPTSAFHELVVDGAITVAYYGASACPPKLALNASIDRGAIRVVPDVHNETVYFVLDTDRLLFHPLGGGQPTTDTRVKGHHSVSITLRASSPFTTENITAENHYHVNDAGVEFNSRYPGLIDVAARPNQSIRGKTTLAAGTELTVVLHPYTASTRPIKATTVVTPARTFEIRIDFANVTTGALYVVEVRNVTQGPVIHGGAPVLAVGNATGAIVTARNQTSDGTILYGPSLTTTHGGFVVVRNTSGHVIGVSDYHDPGATVAQIELVPPLTRNQTLTVTVYRDKNRNREFDAADSPYQVDGTVVRDTVTVGLHSPQTADAISTSQHTRTDRVGRSASATTPNTSRTTTDTNPRNTTVILVTIPVLVVGAVVLKRLY